LPKLAFKNDWDAIWYRNHFILKRRRLDSFNFR
jgi:hypothetical protein